MDDTSIKFDVRANFYTLIAITGVVIFWRGIWTTWYGVHHGMASLWLHGILQSSEVIQTMNLMFGMCRLCYSTTCMWDGGVQDSVASNHAIRLSR